MKHLIVLCIFIIMQVCLNHGIHAQHAHAFESTAIDRELIFKNIQGDTLILSEMRGKLVFINIWATWCGPCRSELPGINQLYQLYKNNSNVQFLLVDADNHLPKSQKFLNKKGLHLPLYASVNAMPGSLFRGVLPTTMVFDKNGVLVMYYEGAANYAHAHFIKAFDAFIHQ